MIASIDDRGLIVKPRQILRRHPLCVGGTHNAVLFETEYAGEVIIVGKGAGGMETGGAILRDLIDIRKGINTI